MQAFRGENSKYFKSTFDLEVDKPYLVYDAQLNLIVNVSCKTFENTAEIFLLIMQQRKLSGGRWGWGVKLQLFDLVSFLGNHHPIK